MKKNKYRWREMKDEPELGEWVFISLSDGSSPYWLRLPSIILFQGSNRDHWKIRTKNGDEFWCDVSRHTWRKMCKLPGEE